MPRQNACEKKLPPVELSISMLDFGFAEYEMWPRNDDYAYGMRGILIHGWRRALGSHEAASQPLLTIDARVALSRRIVTEGVARARFVDAWALRESFLTIKTHEDALRFLNENGLIIQLSHPKRGERAFTILFSDLQRCQEMVRDALVSPIDEHLKKSFPAEWRAGLQALPLRLRLIGKKQPAAEIVFADGLAAMLASVQIDKAWNAEFQRCLRCGRVFEKRSLHKRMYCEYACGHAAGEQKRRDRNAKSEMKLEIGFRKG